MADALNTGFLLSMFYFVVKCCLHIGHENMADSPKSHSMVPLIAAQNGASTSLTLFTRKSVNSLSIFVLLSLHC